MLHHTGIRRAIGTPLAAFLTVCLSAGIGFAQDAPLSPPSTTPETQRVPPSITPEAAREAEVHPIESKKSVEVVFAIDCSDSMTHAIDAAKDVIATILKNIEKEYPSGTVRVGFIRYGDAERQYAVYDLTADRNVSSRLLNETHTVKIRTEYVGAFIKKALTMCSWTFKPNVDRRIYVVGNESAEDGPVDYRAAAYYAAQKGISVHGVYCPLPNEEFVIEQARRQRNIRQGVMQSTPNKTFLTTVGEQWMEVQNTWLLMAYLGGGECYKVDPMAHTFRRWNALQVQHLIEVEIPREARSAQEMEFAQQLFNLRQNNARAGRR